ncbi:MAG: NUDIX hydrolase [Acidimicrobiales bacterium]|nr:NUDIX hydrolase [Acidimicrobiales bacterium]
MTAFRKLGEEELHRGHVIRVVRSTFEAPDGQRFERDVVHTPGAVGIVPVRGAGTDASVLLIRQYRPAIERELLEIPAGLRDVAGEPPEQTAARELVEEVGVRARRIEHLCSFFSSAGFTDMEVHLYLGRDLEPATATAHGPEEQHLTVEEVAVADVPALLAGGGLLDAKTIIGLTAALRRLRELP